MDALLAIKLMSSRAYWIDYRYHGFGEDLGWAANAKAAGVRLGWTSRCVSKHVMQPDQLEQVDPRCGY